MFTDTATNLSFGGRYHYYSDNIGGTTWQSVFCSGVGCEGMMTVDVGTAALQVMDSGYEWTRPYESPGICAIGCGKGSLGSAIG